MKLTISTVGSHCFCLQMLVVIFFFSTVVQATLVLPVERITGLGCIPEGRPVSYQCTVTDTSNGIGSTVWEGSAFICDGNSISLAHSQFIEPDGASDTCGDLSGSSIGANGNEYTSNITLTASVELNGTSIICTLSSLTDFGSDIIKTGAFPPSPQSAIVEVTSPSSLTVGWTQPFDISNVKDYLFTVTGEDCGNCVNTTVNPTTSVSCSGWMARGQTCYFQVWTLSQDCGFMSVAPVNASVFLSVPLSPSEVNLTYSRDSCSFTNAILRWMGPSLSAGLPLIQMYNVMVNNGAAMFTTGTETTLTIPDSIFSGAGTYSFSVSAVNVLGASAPIVADFDVALTSVSSSNTTTMTSAILSFFLDNPACVGASANIVVYYQECFDQGNGNFSMNTSSALSSSIILVMIPGLRAGVSYCYRSEVISAGTIIGFENDQMFTTVPPNPPLMINNDSRLVNSESLTYQCVNSVEGFNGGSSQTAAMFDPATGHYSVPRCSIFVWLIAVIVILVIVLIVGVIVGVILTIYLVKKHAEKADDEQDITEKTSSPPVDSLYADPNTIEHEAAPGTEDQYAMIDRKVKKNTKPKPTPPEALYQDPNTIEHETAASGDTYAVVDKPKRSSKKKGGPDVVPPASEGLTYADIDLSSKRPKPGSGRQAPQQPGEYPKEHPVEYSSVDHGNTSQL